MTRPGPSGLGRTDATSKDCPYRAGKHAQRRTSRIADLANLNLAGDFGARLAEPPMKPSRAYLTITHARAAAIELTPARRETNTARRNE